ncbi:O-antigen ligase family protein [Patescibacteria group bacterium]|nr:O-antigen ligase family protein [Patescibacteria group bacterium]
MARVLLLFQRFALYLLLLGLPFFTHYLFVHPFAFSFVNLFSLIFIGLGVIAILTGQLPIIQVKDRSLVLILCLFFASLLYALPFTHPLRDALGVLLSRGLQAFLVGWLVYLMLEADKIKLENIVRCLFLSFIPLAFTGLLQVSRVLQFSQGNRLYEPYDFPNTLARYLFTLILLSFPWLLTQKKQRWGWDIWWVGLILLLGTQSYNGIVAFLVGVIYLLYLLPSPYRAIRRTGATAWTATVIFIAIFARHLPKWEVSITSSRLSRLEFWQVAIATLKSHYHFLTGIGLKGWENTYPQLVALYGPNHPPLNWNSPQPHNFFLDSLLKAGIPGLIAITLLLLWPIWRGWHASRHLSFNKYGWFGMSVSAVTLALLSFGLIDDPIWSDDMMPLLMILLFSLAWVYSKANPLTVKHEE